MLEGSPWWPGVEITFTDTPDRFRRHESAGDVLGEEEGSVEHDRDLPAGQLSKGHVEHSPAHVDDGPVHETSTRPGEAPG